MTTNVAECHDRAMVQCPESSAGGAPCAMHHMQGAAHHHTASNDQKPPNECAIRGICGGPLSALFAIFTTQGVLTDSSEAFPDIRSSDATFIRADQLIALLSPPDAPPPRS